MGTKLAATVRQHFQKTLLDVVEELVKVTGIVFDTQHIERTSAEDYNIENNHRKADQVYRRLQLIRTRLCQVDTIMAGLQTSLTRHRGFGNR